MGAVILVVAVILLMSYHPFEKSTDALNSLEMQRNFNDALDLMDRDGTLQQMDSSEIVEDLNAVLPIQYDWKLRIREYRYFQQEFVKTDDLSAGNTSKDTEEESVVKGSRLFLSFSDEKINRFHYAEYWGWLKNE
ncbi:MAG: hypothetical protein ABIE23_06215 [archaeon]